MLSVPGGAIRTMSSSGGLPSLSGAFSTLLIAALFINGVFSAESWLAVAVLADVVSEVLDRLGGEE